MSDRDRPIHQSRGELEATGDQGHREAERTEPPQIQEALDACSDLTGHRKAPRTAVGS